MIFPSETDPQTGEPTGFKFELLSSGAKDLSSIRLAIQDYKADLAAIIHANFIRVGTGNTGSYALDKNKTAFFALTLTSLIDGAQAVINRFAVDRLMALNGVPQEAWPTIEHGDIMQSGLDEVAEYISSLSGHITPNIETENELRRRGNLPAIEVAETNEEGATVIPTVEISHANAMIEIARLLEKGEMSWISAKGLLMTVYSVEEDRIAELIGEEPEEKEEEPEPPPLNPFANPFAPQPKPEEEDNVDETK
jgi:hypothetical protein